MQLFVKKTQVMSLQVDMKKGKTLLFMDPLNTIIPVNRKLTKFPFNLSEYDIFQKFRIYSTTFFH